MGVVHFPADMVLSSQDCLVEKLSLVGAIGAKVDYIRRVVDLKGWYSVGGNLQEPAQVFQVVWLVGAGHKFVATVKDNEACALEAGIHKYEVHRARDVDGMPVLDLFRMSDALERVDIMKMAEWGVLVKHFYRWDKSDSDVPGCIRLLSHRRAVPSLCALGLAGPAPVVMLYDALKEAGWKLCKPGQPNTQLRAPPRPGLISRDKLGMRSYLQALLYWPTLHARGLVSLGHSRSSKYYTLVLRAEKPGEVQRSESDAVYSRLLAESRAQSAIPLVRRERDGMVGSDDDGDALLSSG